MQSFARLSQNRFFFLKRIITFFIGFADILFVLKNVFCSQNRFTSLDLCFFISLWLQPKECISWVKMIIIVIIFRPIIFWSIWIIFFWSICITLIIIICIWSITIIICITTILKDTGIIQSNNNSIHGYINRLSLWSRNLKYNMMKYLNDF